MDPQLQSNVDAIRNFQDAAAAVRWCETLDAEERASILRTVIEIVDAVGVNSPHTTDARKSLALLVRNLEFVDQSRTCVECGRIFLVTASEQQFLLLKFGNHSLPSRCRACRRIRREQRASGA